jgi:hypothetical protein
MARRERKCSRVQGRFSIWLGGPGVQFTRHNSDNSIWEFGAKKRPADQVFLCASSTGTITELPNREPYRQFAGANPGWGREESWIGKHSG